MLDVKNIRVSYDHIPAIHDVSFRVDKGEIVTIVGSNGAGKTTIIRAIAGILRLDHGEIRFLDKPIEKLASYERVARGISLVPEGRHLVWGRTADVGYSARFNGQSKAPHAR